MLSQAINSLDRIKVTTKTSEDLTCSICRSIFVEPVLLPCGHGFCLACFNAVVEYNSLTCPYCRKRFSTWLRYAIRNKTLVDQKLWTFIKTNFEQNVSKESDRQSKENISDTARKNFVCIDVSKTTKQAAAAVTAAREKSAAQKISQPGEIRKEYEAQLQIFRKELEIDKQNELKATTAYIVQLYKEDIKSDTIKSTPPDTPPTTPNETMLVANPGHTPYALNTKKTNCSSSSDKKRNVGPSSTSTSTHLAAGTVVLSQSVGSSSTALIAQSSKCNLIKTLAVRLNRGTDLLKQSVQKAIISKVPQGFLSATINKKEVLTVPPTNTHRAPSRNSNSADSLKLEMCHFKPIRTVPTTPSKRAHVDILRTPKAKRVHGNKRINNCDKNSPDPQSRILHPNLLQTTHKSAFCFVGTLPKNLSSQNHSSITTSHVKKRSENHKLQNDIRIISKRLKSEIIRNNPIVLLKRCQINSITAINNNKSKKTQQSASNSTKVKSGRRNGLRIDPKRYKYRNNKKLTDETESETLKRIIIDQKKCEEIIDQERRDFELAKKLQAQLNDRSIGLRTSSRKPRSRLISANHCTDDIDSNGPPFKRCRRTCGRTLALDETIVGASNNKKPNKNIDGSNFCNLRRSTRQIKPTRK